MHVLINSLVIEHTNNDTYIPAPVYRFSMWTCSTIPSTLTHHSSIISRIKYTQATCLHVTPIYLAMCNTLNDNIPIACFDIFPGGPGIYSVIDQQYPLWLLSSIESTLKQQSLAKHVPFQLALCHPLQSHDPGYQILIRSDMHPLNRYLLNT